MALECELLCRTTRQYKRDAQRHCTTREEEQPVQPTRVPPQERLNLTDRVYSVPSYVTAPCGQYLLNCSDGVSHVPVSHLSFFSMKKHHV